MTSSPRSRPGDGIADDPGASAVRLYGGQEAVTELVTATDGRRAVRKRPRPDQDAEEARFYQDGEELFPLLAEAVGAPVAATRRDGEAIWVEYIEGDLEVPDHLIDTPEGIRLGLADALAGNRDRQGNLFAVDGGRRLMGFDHGGAWLDVEMEDPGPYLRERDAPMRHFVHGDTWRSDPPLTAAELGPIRERVAALRPAFERRGRGAWLDYSLAMLDDLTRQARSGQPAATLAAPADADLTIGDVIEADADMAVQIMEGVMEARATVDGCDRLITKLEAVHAKILELRVPGSLEGMLLGLVEKALSVRANAEALAEKLPAASEAIAVAGSAAESRHKPLADAVADAGHIRPAERDYH